MDPNNPFRSPDNPPGPPPLPSRQEPPRPDQGPWREGDLVVTTFHLSWPPRCFITGEDHPPHQVDITARFSPSWGCLLFAGLFLVLNIFGLIIALIVMASVEQKVKLRLGMSQDEFQRRQSRIQFANIVFLISLLIMGASVVFFLNNDLAGILIFLVGLLLLGIAVGRRQASANPLKIKDVQGNWIRVSGAGQGFLATLPAHAYDTGNNTGFGPVR